MSAKFKTEYFYLAGTGQNCAQTRFRVSRQHDHCATYSRNLSVCPRAGSRASNADATPRLAAPWKQDCSK